MAAMTAGTLATLLFGTAIAVAPTANSKLKGSKPNVLVLFADDMGVGDLSVLGHPTIHSPNLDRLANGGVRFTAWYSGFHICSPSRAAMLTGRLCIRSGTCGSGWLGGVFSNKPVGGLPTNETTFASHLRSAGYATAAMGKWHLGTKPQFMPTGHGFDHYYGIPYSVDMGRSAWRPAPGNFPPLPLVEGDAVVEQPANLDTLSTRYAAFAESFIVNSTMAETPFLLYLAFQHVHIPDFASPAFCGVSRRGLFGDVVEELDWLVGRVLDAVSKAGVQNDTITFFSSDNGPWTIEHLRGGSAGPFRDGKGSVWEGGVREPGFVHWPGTISPYQVVSEPAATYDIFPTVLGLAGVELPVDRIFDGKDLLPLLTGQESRSPHKCIFYWKGCTDQHWCGVPADSPLAGDTPGLWAVRCGGYKTHFFATNISCTVHYMPPGHRQSSPLIYRIDEDPSERFPLSPENNKQEYEEQLVIAKKAVKDHISSLNPVRNQIGLGSDAKIRQDGGSALCKLCPANEQSEPSTCLCDAQNLNAFVCKDNHTADPPQRPAPEELQASHRTTKSQLGLADAPNVVMLFIDDSGYGDTTVYGAPSTLTTAIDKMAREGARFTQWYSAHPICTPSRAALMTGRLPIRYGLASTSSGKQSVFTCRSKLGMPHDETTMPELLRSVGFRTHMVGKWHLGSTPGYFPTDHGFESYFGIPFSVDMGFAFSNRTEESWSEGNYYGCTPLPLMANTTVLEQPVDLATVNARYTSSAVDFIRTSFADKAKFFLYLAFGHVHTPQFAGKEQFGKSKRGIFGDSVAEVDHAVSAVMHEVQGSNTMVILSSDNGAPDSYQHKQPGQPLDAITGSNALFLGGKTQTWEGGLRVPGIIWWPGQIAPQLRFELASTLDVFATVADAVGVALPKNKIYDSYSMLPLLLGKAEQPPRNASFFYAGATLMAVRVGRYKAHLQTVQPEEPHAGPDHGFLAAAGVDHQPYGPQKPWLLFDIEKDPSEMFPIRCPSNSECGSILTALQEAVEKHRSELGKAPQGVLDVDCVDGEGPDCRICCDVKKNCTCSAPPTIDAMPFGFGL